jgi:hypothetical protein
MNKNKHRLYALSLFFLIALNLANSILTVQVVQNLSCHANYLSIYIYITMIQKSVIGQSKLQCFPYSLDCLLKKS